MEIAQIQAMTVLAVGIIFGLGRLRHRHRLRHPRRPLPRGLGTPAGALPVLRIQMFIVAGLLDAVAMIGIGFALFFTFANPFLGALHAAH